MKNITIPLSLIIFLSIKSNAQSYYIDYINKTTADSLVIKMEAERDAILDGNPDKYYTYGRPNEAAEKIADSFKDKYEAIAKTIFNREVESNDYKAAINPSNQIDNVILFTKDYGETRITFGTKKSFITCRGMKNRPYQAELHGSKTTSIKLDKDVIIINTNELLHNGFSVLFLSSNKGGGRYEMDSDNHIIKDLMNYLKPEIKKLIPDETDETAETDITDKNAVFEISRSEAIRFSRDSDLYSKIWMNSNDDSIDFTMNTDGKFYSEKDENGNRIILDIIKYENKQLTYRYIDKANKINKTVTLTNIN